MKGWEQWTNGSIERDMKDLETAHLFFEVLADKHVLGTPYEYLTCRGNLLANNISTNHTVCMSNLTGIFG